MDTLNERSPKYVFLHLFTFALLYVCVVSVIALLFQYISILVPDQLQGYSYGSYDTIRSTSSALLVCYPVFIALSWMLQRDMQKQPNLRDMRIRKWLMSLTLFVAAITILIDFIQVVYQFYGGEITTQFFLKLLTVLIIAAGVFGYYFWEYRRESTPSRLPHLLAWVTSAILLVILVSGFFIAGSPAHQRSVRFDEQRTTDLQIIQSQIVSYWQTQQKLPASLTDLTSSLTGYAPASDPKTGAAYGYHVTGEKNFQLCADFDTDSNSGGAAARYPDYGIIGLEGSNWNHGKGIVCFERTIDATVLLPVPVKKQ